MSNPSTCDRNTSQLILIDVQEKLCGVMPQPGLATVLRNCSILLQAAQLLEIPALVTEQYPKGLGSTHTELAPYLQHTPLVEKTCFSCCDEPTFRIKMSDGHPQIVLAGMESHICVLQTALALASMGRQPFVVEDAVLSRNPENKTNAMQRLRQAGVIVTSAESVVFEWLGSAEGPAFKQISRLLR
jgi:nicotinamidase-related amidase